MQAVELLPIVQCPTCRAKLADLRLCASCGLRFATAGGLPLLVDFEGSILQPEDFSPNRRVIAGLKQGTRLGAMLSRFTYGGNINAAEKMHVYLRHARALSCRPRILVIGGGSIGAGMQGLYAAQDIDLVGVDIYESPSVVLLCDGHRLPFVDGSFDGVVIQAVLEHVVDPAVVVGEVHRVLRTGGLVYSETPFMQQVHDGAYDFTRYTLSGHRWLFRQFSEVEAGTALGPGFALLWSISYFVKAVTGSPRAAALITALFFWVRFLDRKMPKGLALDAASGLYFLGIRAETSLNPTDLLSYYERHR
jgi:SAM-dependent methyltransferase